MLRRQAGEETSKILLACVGAGVAQGITVFSVLTGLEQLSGSGVKFHVFLLFLASLGVFYALFHYITERAALLALQGVMDWRMRIAAKLRGIPLEDFGRISGDRIQAVLLDGREMVVEAARMFMAAAANSVMMVVAVGKMLATSFIGACGVLCCMGLGLYVFLRLVTSVQSLLEPARKADAKFSASLRDLQGGFQHLKVHKGKTCDLFSNWLTLGLARASRAREAMERRHALGISFFAQFNLLILGLILFLMPRVLGVDADDVTTLLVLAMFCLSPLMSLVGFVPMLGKVELSLRELADMEKTLDAALEPCEVEAVRANWRHSMPVVPPFASLSLRNIAFEYHDKDGTPLFAVHIADFSLRRGEIVFIRGGNGAGKSTFMKVLSGLYVPQSGEICLNDRPLADVGIEAYRNLFSIVPADFHIFKYPLGLNAAPERVRAVLALMRLDSKVSLEADGSFSTLDLSAGQRKRLALACALLEDRDVCLFDEVAADFDPEFRRFFYETLLPDLRAQGKTILAVSHDDRYFPQADRVLVMGDGVLAEDTRYGRGV